VFALYTGCLVQFIPVPPLVMPTLVAPQTLMGKASKTMIGSMPACLEGDELPMTVKMPCSVPYLFGPFVGGMGHIELLPAGLPPDFYTKATGSNKKLLRVGAGGSGMCQMFFCVDVPAMNPTGVPDPVPKKPINAQYLPPPLMVQAPA